MIICRLDQEASIRGPGRLSRFGSKCVCVLPKPLRWANSSPAGKSALPGQSIPGRETLARATARHSDALDPPSRQGRCANAAAAGRQLLSGAERQERRAHCRPDRAID